MSQAPQQVDDSAFLIGDVETLKAVAEPQRIRLLLELAEGPLTVKELARNMGVPPTRLYYHVKILEKHGFIRVARRRMVSGIEERSYEAVAHNWTLADEMWSEVAGTGVVKALFDVVRAEFEVAIEREGAPKVDNLIPSVVLTKLFLDDDGVVEVQKRLEAIMEDFGIRSEHQGKPEYHALLTVYKTGLAPG